MSCEVKRIFIFIPDSLPDNTEGYLQGFVKIYEDNLTFYITSDKLQNTPNYRNSVGYFGKNYKKDDFGDRKHLLINSITCKIDYKNCENYETSTCVKYNFKAFFQSEIIENSPGNYGKHFEMLHEAVKMHKTNGKPIKRFEKLWVNLFLILAIFTKNTTNVLHKINAKFKHINSIQYMEKYLLQFNNFFNEFKINNNKFSVKATNLLISILLNVTLSIIFAYLIAFYSNEVMHILKYSTEEIIHKLKEVLSILMGSPAGLKLNYAFNNALGKFFFFHIDLWKSFLHESKPFIDIIVNLFINVKFLGFSLQLAIIMDFIAFLTFHVYCIYIYAARLYWMQVRALISLWRLFIGRKYNPLRNRVDSCVYSHHQLFIGTLGFTICLFLLPTTLLYYGVFTVFRIILIAIGKVLSTLIDKIERIPLYLSVLWVLNSPFVAGNIYMSYKHNKMGKSCLYVTLKKLSYFETISKFSKNNLNKLEENGDQSLGCFLKDVCTGKLL